MHVETYETSGYRSIFVFKECVLLQCLSPQIVCYPYFLFATMAKERGYAKMLSSRCVLSLCIKRPISILCSYSRRLPFHEKVAKKRNSLESLRTIQLNIPEIPVGELGRFPFNKNHQFKLSEFSLVEWNASDRFPEFGVTCSATQGMRCWVRLYCV